MNKENSLTVAALSALSGKAPVTLTKLRERFSSVLGEASPASLAQMAHVLREKTATLLGGGKQFFAFNGDGTVGEIEARLSFLESKPAAPTIPTTTFTPLAARPAAQPAAPSTELLKHLADAVFGPGTAAKECRMPWPQLSTA